MLHECMEKRQRNGTMVARVVRPATLVSYQKGALVSREVLKQKTGTVTVFAFDKAQGLSEHTAPFDALVLILDGKAEITISGRRHSLQKGEMIVMPANQPHVLRAQQRFKMMLVMINQIVKRQRRGRL